MDDALNKKVIMKRIDFLIAGVMLIFALGGCVERLITVTSEPAGALVWMGGEEVGNTPVTVPFTWYGTYDVVLRMDGYETVKTQRRVNPPIYQWPGLDLIFETVVPFELVDRHEWEFDSAEQQQPDRQALIGRARELRAEAAQELGQ